MGYLLCLLAALCAACAAPFIKQDTALSDVDGTLDAWHQAAARADEQAYFGTLAEDAVFIGTDAGERWSKAQFAAYAQPYFAAGKAWTYVPVERHVKHSHQQTRADGQYAWFDERLENPKYGAARGSGVLRFEGGRWRIVHYVLSFPIPNDLAQEFTEKIRAVEQQKL